MDKIMLLSSRSKDITGQKFGSLAAIQPDHKGNDGTLYWEFLCNCGKKHVARGNTVVHQAKKGDIELPSCGCVELARKTKHGFRKAKDTHPAYRAYRSIMTRCYNSNDTGYRWYGAIGVTICDEWKDNPEAFIKWSIDNGWQPGLHIDKDIICRQKGIEPGIYSPDTCQWITAKENIAFSNNRDNYGKHLNIKLNHADIARILYLYFNKGITGVQLAKDFNVAHSSIYRLIALSKGQ